MGEPGRACAVSVVMPTLDCVDYVGEALTSALDQRGVDLEVIVQDGGSRDGTKEVIESFEDPRIRLESRSDRGQSAALNGAIARARGEWIVWLNGDDRLAADALRSALDRAPANCDLVIGDFEVIDDAGSLLKESRPPPLSRRRLLRDGCYLFSGACLFRATLFERFGGLDSTLRYAMDYEFLLRIAPEVRSTRAAIVVGQFRRHRGSKTESGRWTSFREVVRIRRRYQSLLASAPGLLALSLNTLARPLWNSAAWLRLRPTGGLRYAAKGARAGSRR